MPSGRAESAPVDIRVIHGTEITDYILRDVLELFNKHYGRYGKHAEDLNPYLIPGTPVQLSLSRLRHLNLSDVDVCELALAYNGLELVGFAFCTRWKYPMDGGEAVPVCWITLAVVHQSHREQGIATSLIKSLIRPTDKFWGMASWSAAGAKALVRATKDTSIEELDLETIKRYAPGILKKCEVSALRDGKLEGSLFEEKPGMEGVVSCVNTKNYVDIDDVEVGISRAKRSEKWPLGRLPEGGEFLVVVENKNAEKQSQRSV